jgi:hypothetical protein
MNIVVIEAKTLQEMLDRLAAIEQRIEPKGESPEHQWLDNQEFCQFLKISKRTAQNYRDQGIVAFSQIGSKVYYKLADVHALLESNRVATLRIGRR